MKESCVQVLGVKRKDRFCTGTRLKESYKYVLTTYGNGLSPPCWTKKVTWTIPLCKLSLQKMPLNLWRCGNCPLSAKGWSSKGRRDQESTPSVKQHVGFQPGIYSLPFGRKSFTCTLMRGGGGNSPLSTNNGWLLHSSTTLPPKQVTSAHRFCSESSYWCGGRHCISKMPIYLQL